MSLESTFNTRPAALARQIPGAQAAYNDGKTAGLPRSLTWRTVTFAIVACLILLGFEAWREWVARDVQLQETSTALVNLASSLSQHAEDTVEIADTVLAGLVERLETNGTGTDAQVPLNGLLAGRVAALPRVRDLVVIREDGTRFASSSPVSGESGADRAYFRHHRDDRARTLFIGPPIRSHSNGRWTLTVSRRFDHPDGRFAGVAVAAIDMPYFVEYYKNFDVGANGTILLLNTSGTLLARYPFDEAIIGKDVSTAVVFSKLPESPVGSYETTAVLDGVRRFSGYRQSSRYPLVSVVGMSVDQALGAWRTDARLHMIGAAILAGIIALLGLHLARQMAQRQAAELRVRDNEKCYRLLAENSSDFIVLKPTLAGPRTYVSPACMAVNGYTPEEFAVLPVDHYVHPDDLKQVAAEHAALTVDDPHLTSVHRVRHKAGHWIWVETVFYLTDAGTSVVVRSRDITARHEAEQALKASEARYRLLADSTTDVITCLDLDFNRTYISPSCRVVFGCEPEELLGTTPESSMHPDDRAETLARLRRLAAGETDAEMATNRIRHKKGHWIWIEANLGLLRDTATGKPGSITCSIRDISDRMAQSDALRAANAELDRLARHLYRARDRAEKANRAKSRFLAGASHELRTPLNGILGYTELLRLEGGLNPLQAERVDAMLGAGKHLLEMINCVLDLSQIEAGHIELQPQAFIPEDIASACLDLVRPTAEAKRLSLSLISALDPSRHVVADPMRLRQVLLNLLGNAVKFTPKGSVELRLRLSGPAMLRIEVADTGAGIPADQRHRLFQDFDRLAADAGTIEGSGLGLALSARLAALMGGSLGHQDNAGGGSVFWMEMPVENVVLPAAVAGIAATPQAEAAVLAPEIAVAQTLRILVVDDVAMNRDIAGSFLRAAGHAVQCVESGADAVAAASTQDFNVILMDVRMPGMDGLEATGHIRALAGPRGQVPVIALTAQAFSEQVAECRRVGMNSHLAKPFTQTALLEAVSGFARVAEALPDEAATAEPTRPSPAASLDAELPILNAAAFASTAAFISDEAVVSYLRTLAERGEALLCLLQHPDGFAHGAGDLAAAAHTLAGSAGMFGFERLAATARRFEHAIHGKTQDAPALAKALASDTELSLHEMRRLALRNTAIPELVGHA